jgi:hypothetical protein
MPGISVKQNRWPGERRIGDATLPG